MGASVGVSKQPKPLLSFRAVLDAQLDQTLSYASLKRLLRALKSSSAISSYPSRASTQPLLTLSLSQPSQPQSESRTVSQCLQQSPDPCGSLRTLSERPSRLRRKRRSSRRPPLKSVGNDVQRELFLTPGSSPTPLQSSPERDWNASKVQTVPPNNVSEVASRINYHLNNLLDICPPHSVVTWPQLRNLLVGADHQTYSPFCKYIDEVGFFDPDEPLATGQLGSPSVKACAYYSNSFWEQALRDFQASEPSR